MTAIDAERGEMRVRIHRGAAEIGGNCVEVASDEGQRIVLDVGRPLSAGWSDTVEPPAVPGLGAPCSSLCGVLISHPHLDHYGLLGGVDPSVPVYIGAEAAAVLGAAQFFSPAGVKVEPTGVFRDRQPLTIGPFTVTPFLNDHSAFDAYSLLIEADGRRLFYTGDIRAHGRKARLFEALLARPPSAVHAMLMEGTHVRADAAHDAETFVTEAELEHQFVDLLGATTGVVAVLGSAQNIDRLVTVYRAARRTGRQLVVDLYGATVAAATRSSIPQVGFPDLRVYVPQRQRVLVKQSGEFERVNELRACRVFVEEMLADPSRFVFHVPSSTAYELMRSGVLDSSGAAVWSLWDGYLREPSGRRLRAALSEHEVGFSTIHTSGHASVPDLQRLVAAIRPDRVVPMHSEATNRFAELFPRVEPHPDNEWWQA
jgi:ribonuclease J